MAKFFNRKRLILGLACIMSILPFLLVDQLTRTYIRNHVSEELHDASEKYLTNAERRLSSVEKTLTQAVSMGVANCEYDSLKSLRYLAANTAAVYSLTIMDPMANVLCSTNDAINEKPAPLSIEVNSSDEAVSLALVQTHLDESGSLRMKWRGQDAKALYAYLHQDFFILPHEKRESEFGFAKLQLAETPFIITPAGTNFPKSGDYFYGSARGERYPVELAMARSIQSAHHEYWHLFLFSWIISVLLGAAILTVGYIYSRTETDVALAELKDALAAGELVPFYQPVIDLETGRVKGCEVLVRWRKPNGTYASPISFIALAETSGLTFEMTRSLLASAIQELGSACAIRPKMTIAFNFVADHFTNNQIVSDILRYVSESPLNPSQIIVEITERKPLEDMVKARQIIAELQSHGIKVALDDVGTGHSGLSYILKLGVDIIKIDKLFVDAIGTEKMTASIIESLVEMAKTAEMDIVAEGVETFEQIRYLRSKGVHYAQGFVFAPPLPGTSFLALLEAMDPVQFPNAHIEHGHRLSGAA